MTLFEKYNKFAKKNPYLNGLGILGVVWVLFLTGSSLLGVFHFLYWIGAIGLICSSLLFNKDVVAYYVAGNDTSEILKLVKSFKAPKRPLLSFLFLATLFAFGWHVLLLIYSVALLFLYRLESLFFHAECSYTQHRAIFES